MRPAEYFAELHRELDWQLKRALPWSRAVRPQQCNWRTVRAQLNQTGGDRLQSLVDRYPIDGWPGFCNRGQILESLYVLDVLDRHLPERLQSGHGSTALDIGSKSWAYLPGLHARYPAAWTGVELDAHLRYIDLTTRRAHGEAMATRFDSCHYRAGNVLGMAGQFDLITWFFPFVTERPLEGWGLPARFFQPSRLLEHVCSLLKPGAHLLILNQTDREAEVQAHLLEQSGIKQRRTFRLQSAFSPERGDHPGSLIQCPARQAPNRPAT